MAGFTKPLLPLPEPRVRPGSSEIVRVLDKIRFGPLDARDEYAEFVWFAREYPRVYRHHFDHAEHRLLQIRAAYEAQHLEAKKLIPTLGESYEVAFSRRSRGGVPNTYEIYWNFECYLTAICSALDVAARIAGTAYKQDTPPSFNRFRKSAPPGDLRAIFESSHTRWVRRVKSYRDCFVHYTPVDTLLALTLREYTDGWQLRARLPTNPDEREILMFRYSRKLDLLGYAVTLWHHFNAFDRALGRELWKAYCQGKYPVKIKGLFSVGRRSTSTAADT